MLGKQRYVRKESAKLKADEMRIFLDMEGRGRATADFSTRPIKAIEEIRKHQQGESESLNFKGTVQGTLERTAIGGSGVAVAFGISRVEGKG